MYGFVESLNVTVASALVLQVGRRGGTQTLPSFGCLTQTLLSCGCLTQRSPSQRLFDLCPDARGDLSHEVRTAAIQQWTGRGLVT
jgi:hypothetical protein